MALASQKGINTMLDLKKDFPVLNQTVNGRLVAYLDSAASAQKPQSVIDAMTRIMETHYSNVHRGVYTFGSQTSIAYETSRQKIAQFLGAKSEKEIIFTRNATEAINLVATSYGRTHLKSGDEVILTELEHHANIVPWYMLAQEMGIVIRVVPILADGSLDMDAYGALLSDKTKFVSVIHMSNALGTVNDVKSITAKAHAVGAKVLIDGSQAAVHLDVNVQDIGADFYAVTGHKLYGPSGIGVLYGHMDVLDTMPPYQGGGEMIEDVAFDRVTFKKPPYRFEAGTPAIVEAIGLGAAIDYLSGLNKSDIQAHEKTLLTTAEERLGAIEGVHIYSRAENRASILSFTMDKVHPHDAATVFDQMGLCVRAGHHCAQPLMKVLGVTATIRASFALYNTMDDVDRLVEAVEKVKKLFK